MKKTKDDIRPPNAMDFDPGLDPEQKKNAGRKTGEPE